GTTTPLTYTKATSEASSEYETEEGVLKKKLFIQSKKHFGGAFVNITHSTVHVPTIIYSLST
ncbi:unnamed protein product, partial [Rotaria magnacalcarata]